MGDNVTITAGSGTGIATDDVSGQHYQRIKLVDGTADSTALIPGDATNGLYVQVRQVQRLAAYSAIGHFVAPASTNTFWEMYGSNTSTIRVRRIRVSGLTLTAVAYSQLELKKFSTQPVGGTVVNMTQVPLDSADSGGLAAVCRHYSAFGGYTAGTLLGGEGTVRSLMNATTAAAGGYPNEVVWDFCGPDGRSNLVIRSSSQGVGINFSSLPASAVTGDIEVTWSQE